MPVTHTFTSAIPDDPAAAAAGQVLPSHWNANHTVSVAVSEITATGTPSASTYLRGDGSWQSVTTAPAGSNGDFQINNAGAFGALTPGSGVSTFLTTPSSANLAAAVTDETGSGALVFATSPTLTTPNLGTPSALTLTNATGLPVGGISATGTPSASTFLRGDGSWQSVAASPGGSNTQIQFNNSGAFGGSSSLTWDGTAIITPSVNLAGNISAAAWTTNGIGLRVTSRTLTDTTSTGTVAAAYTNVLGGNTIAASSATTFTNYASLHLNAPAAGSNVTITNPYALSLAGNALIASGTLTASAPALDVTQTWNNSGVTFTGLKLNVTDTASASGSLLMDLQTDGTSRFNITKAGNVAIQINGSGSAPAIGRGTTGLYFSAANGQMYGTVNGTYQFGIMGSGILQILSAGYFGFESAGPASATDVRLYRDTANTLALRNADNGQTFRVYGRGGGTANFERAYINAPTTAGAAVLIGTEKGGTGAARALELQTDGTTRVTVSTTGFVGIGAAPATDSITRLTVQSPDGGSSAIQLNTFSNTASDRSLMVFGRARGTSASPSIVQDGDTIASFQANAYHGTNYNNIASIFFEIDGTPVTSQRPPGRLVFSTAVANGAVTESFRITTAQNIQIADGKNFVFNTTTGTKLGTATSQKLSFWNATPIVQPTTAVAAATVVANSGTAVNDASTFDGYTIAQVVKALRNAGLLA